MRRRILAFFCALTLAVTLSAPVCAAPLAMFTAINDTVLDLAADTMPIWSGGVLYVPYTAFDSNATDIDIDIYGVYSKTNNTVALYGARKMLVFDLEQDNSRDHHTGKTYNAKVIMRNGIPFVPVSMVTSFFELNYALLSTSSGMLLRIKNEDVVLDDAGFVDAASSLLSTRLKDFQKKEDAVNPTEPTVDPVDPVKPNPDPLPTQAATYVGFLCDDGKGIDDILMGLEMQGTKGLFFFAPDDLVSQASKVRHILGNGHSIGLIATGKTAEDSAEQLAEGNRILASIARTRTTVAYVPEVQRAALEEDGWVCWQETRNIVPLNEGWDLDRIYLEIDSMRGTKYVPQYITFDDSSLVSDSMTKIIQRLEKKQFIINVPLEIRL